MESVRWSHGAFMSMKCSCVRLEFIRAVPIFSFLAVPPHPPLLPFPLPTPSRGGRPLFDMAADDVDRIIERTCNWDVTSIARLDGAYPSLDDAANPVISLEIAFGPLNEEIKSVLAHWD